MAIVGQAELVDDTVTETLKDGILIVNINEIYQVFSDRRDEDRSVVLAAPALPVKFTNAYHGNAPGVICYAIARSAKRPAIGATALKWLVTVQYTNDSSAFAHSATGQPVSDPTQAVKRVDVEYLVGVKPTTKAAFLNSTIGPYSEAYDPVAFSATDGIDPTKNMQPPAWLVDKVGPVVNSSGDVRFVGTDQHYRRITVSRIVRNWDDSLLDFRGKINEDEVIIEQVDGPTSSFVRASYKFPALTLRVDDVIKQDRWLGGSLYFQQSIVLVESKETWIHSEQDVGQRQRLFVGQKKDTDGNIYSQADMDAQVPPILAGSHGLVNIVNNGVAIGDPAKLNGHGMPLPIIRDPSDPNAVPVDGDTIYLNYAINDIVSFTGLAL